MNLLEIREIADAAAKKAVSEMLLTIGVDTSAEGAIIALQADFAFIRQQRKAAESLRQNAWRTFWYVVGAGIIGLGSWLIAAFNWPPHP